MFRVGPPIIGGLLQLPGSPWKSFLIAPVTFPIHFHPSCWTSLPSLFLNERMGDSSNEESES